MTDVKPKIIFLIEDDRFLRMVFQKRLQEGGYTVFTAADGEEAINLLGTTVPDLILLDMILPKKNGFEVLQEIRSRDTFKAVPVVALSNLSQGKDVEQAKKMGVAGYLTKSNVSLVNLLDEVRKYLYKS